MPSILDKLKRRSKRRSQDGYTSTGSASGSDTGARSSTSLDISRPIRVSHEGGYHSLGNGSTVLINNKGPAAAGAGAGAGFSGQELPTRTDDGEKEVPPRSTSLEASRRGSDAGERGEAGGLEDKMGRMAIKESYVEKGKEFHRRSMDGKANASLTGLPSTDPKQAFDLPSNSPDEISMDEHPTVVAARNEMVEKLSRDVRDRYKPLTTDQEEIFKRAGLTENLGKKGDVEVITTWLPPVVHETVKQRIRTEITEHVVRERHIHHIYPKIQPIHDTDPILLPPRHRIFSTQTNAWHEVIGDDAAIAILGSDLFHNGYREYRETRAPALPGLTEGEEVIFSEMRGSRRYDPAFEHGAREIQREGERGKMGEWHAIKGRWDGRDGQGEERMIGEVHEGLGKRTAKVVI